MISILKCFCIWLVFLPIIANSQKKNSFAVPIDETSLAANMKVQGVPDDFMALMLRYVNTVSNDAPHPDYIIKRNEEIGEITRLIRKDYSQDAEKYFVVVVQNNKNQLMKSIAYNMFLKAQLNDGLMLDFARRSLKNRNWDGDVYLDSDIGHQLRVLVAYGDESDLELWNDLWLRMDDIEKNAFQAYGKMLTKAVESQDELLRIRAARGDRKYQLELIKETPDQNEEQNGVFNDARVVIALFVLVVLLVLYFWQKRQNKISHLSKQTSTK